jgi:hypothetical protein
MIAIAGSCHTASKAQNAALLASFTAGFGSERAFFMNFSRISTPPDPSIAFLARFP